MARESSEEPDMKVEGQCHCGELSFEAEIDPETVRICHCTDCQTIAGAAYRVNVTATAEHFRLRTGSPKIYTRIAESGNPRANAFCANCGTHIYSAAPLNPPSYSLRVGTLKERGQLRPKRQIWFRSAQPWVTDIREVQHVERQ
jgi:hypothetical protein